ncbi:MAG: amidohydrolase family protein [Xanthomonadales bacterium]|nr:amidohydrolase family protein [Xanthomonadales bacterium]
MNITVYRVNRAIIGLTMAIGISACVVTPQIAIGSQSPVVAFVGGHVFDGTKFEQRTICVSERIFVMCPDEPSKEVRLHGSFITPPFGDAHTHHFDSPYTIDAHTELGLLSGAFYAMTMTARGSQVALIRERLRGPGNVDVSSSLGAITGPDSHPTEIYEALALGAYTFEDQVARADEIRASSLVADDAYFIVETEEDVREKWPLLLESRPDHIKVYLRSSERYDEGFGKWGPGGGIDPELLPLIRKLSRDAGLRMAVANSSIGDFRASLLAEADIITHLPCYQDSSSDESSPYFDVDTAGECLISKEEARRAASQNMISILIVTEWAKDRPEEQIGWERANIKTLREAGAPLAIGVNAYGDSLTDGMIAGVDKGFLSPEELLRVASMDTPRAIFPARRIGCLEVGCEASFIGFDDNPIKNIATIRDISVRFKDGEVLELPQ